MQAMNVEAAVQAADYNYCESLNGFLSMNNYNRKSHFPFLRLTSLIEAEWKANVSRPILYMDIVYGSPIHVQGCNHWTNNKDFECLVIFT